MADPCALIPDELYSQILQVMPIPCVDLLVSNAEGRVLLLKRKNAPAQGEWWFPGGRVHFGETRAVAAVRKLKEECGLEPASIHELGTFDVILEMGPGYPPRHGITTLFHVRVDRAGSIKLDTQSTGAAWRGPDEWRTESLHPFVARGLSMAIPDALGTP